MSETLHARFVFTAAVVAASCSIVAAVRTHSVFICVVMTLCAMINVANGISVLPLCFRARSRDRGTP